MTTIPDDLVDLIQRPLYGSLATVRPDGSPQVNPMWFDFDGTDLRFTHTTKRAKFRNLQHNPGMSFTIFDPDRPIHYVELRGSLRAAEPDPGGDYYVHLGQRYGNPDQQPPPDKADRVVLVMRIDKVLGQ